MNEESKIIPPSDGPGSARPRPSFAKPTREQLENRYTYHAPKGDQTSRYEQVRKAILDAAVICVGLTPASPEQVEALNDLDSAMYNFNASIARNE